MRPDGFTAQLIRALARDEEPFTPRPTQPGSGFWREVVQALGRQSLAPTPIEDEPPAAVEAGALRGEADDPPSQVSELDDARSYFLNFATRPATWRIKNRRLLMEAARFLAIARRLRKVDEVMSDHLYAQGPHWLAREVELRQILDDVPVDAGQLRRWISTAADQAADGGFSTGARPGSVFFTLDGAIGNALAGSVEIARRLEPGHMPYVSGEGSLDVGLAETEDAANAAANDFTGTDLHAERLNVEDLDGVIWSSTTQWPENLRQEIESNSIPRGGGIFEVHLGGVGARGDDHLVLR